jgi:hypothetical protein
VEFKGKTSVNIKSIDDIPTAGTYIYPSTATADGDGTTVGDINTYAETEISNVDRYKWKYGPDTYTFGTTPERLSPSPNSNYINYLTNLLKFIQGEVSGYITAYEAEWDKPKYENTIKPLRIPKDAAGNDIVITNPTNSANLIAVMNGYMDLTSALLIAGNQSILQGLCTKYLDLYTPNKDDCLIAEDKATVVTISASASASSDTLESLYNLAQSYKTASNVPTDSTELSEKQALFTEGINKLYTTLRTRMQSIVSTYHTLWNDADRFRTNFAVMFLKSRTTYGDVNYTSTWANIPLEETTNSEFSSSKTYSEANHGTDKTNFEFQKALYLDTVSSSGVVTKHAESLLNDYITTDLLTPYSVRMVSYVSDLASLNDIADITPYPFTVTLTDLNGTITSFKSQTANLFAERYTRAKTTLSDIVTDANISTANAYVTGTESTDALKALHNYQAFNSLMSSANTNATTAGKLNSKNTADFSTEYQATDTLALLGLRLVNNDDKLNSAITPPSGKTQVQFITDKITTSNSNISTATKASQIKTEWEIYFKATGLRDILRSEVTRLCAIRDYRKAAEAALRKYQSILDEFGDILLRIEHTPYSVSTYITSKDQTDMSDSFYTCTNTQLDDLIDDIEDEMYGTSISDSILKTIKNNAQIDLNHYTSLISGFNDVHTAYTVAIPDLVTALRPENFSSMTSATIPTLPTPPTTKPTDTDATNLGSCASRDITAQTYSEVTTFIGTMTTIRNNFQGQKGQYLTSGHLYLARLAINTAMNTYIDWFNAAYSTLGAEYSGVLVKNFTVQYNSYATDIGKVTAGTAPAPSVFLEDTEDASNIPIGILPRYRYLTDTFLVHNMKYKALMALNQYYTLYSGYTDNEILFNGSAHTTHAAGYDDFLTYISGNAMSNTFDIIDTKLGYQNLIDKFGTGGTEYKKVVEDADANIQDLLTKFLDTVYAKGKTRYQLYCMRKRTEPDTDRTSPRGTGGFSQYFYTGTSLNTRDQHVTGIFGDMPRYKDIKQAIAFVEVDTAYTDIEKCIHDEKVMRYAKNNKDLL